MRYTVAELQPINWLILFSQTFAGLAGLPRFRQLGYGSHLAFLLPGMRLLSALCTALQSGMASVSDIDAVVHERMLTSPVRHFAVLLARYLADAVLMLVQGASVASHLAWPWIHGSGSLHIRPPPSPRALLASDSSGSVAPAHE